MTPSLNTSVASKIKPNCHVVVVTVVVRSSTKIDATLNQCKRDASMIHKLHRNSNRVMHVERLRENQIKST
jgi:hypothetical protein